jgi:hypothetical protein
MSRILPITIRPDGDGGVTGEAVSYERNEAPHQRAYEHRR